MRKASYLSRDSAKNDIKLTNNHSEFEDRILYLRSQIDYYQHRIHKFYDSLCKYAKHKQQTKNTLHSFQKSKINQPKQFFVQNKKASNLYEDILLGKRSFLEAQSTIPSFSKLSYRFE